jgi:glyceraldehyde 3-phosphate dehydrogenase
MHTKIGINGFGRIGRIAFRIASQHDNIEVVAVNDLLDVDHLAYLLEFDSVHGKYPGTISVKDGNLIVDGKTIRVTAERDPLQLKWNEVGAEIIVDCTGIFKELDSASAHTAVRAARQVLLELRAGLGRQVVREVIGQEIGELAARHEEGPQRSTKVSAVQSPTSQ